jgi:type II secretory pathway pseudopilin PulG
MRRRGRNTAPTDQRGAAIMIMLLMLILGAASFLLTKLGKGDARQPDNLAATTDIGAITGALIGYATINGFCLPCPDTDNDGLAEATCGPGAPVAGTLPWVTLGIGALDSWGHRLRYVVDPDFTGVGACVITQSMQSDITVQTRNTAGVLFNLLAAVDNPPAVVIAHGANGYGSVSENGAALALPPASHIDETVNDTAMTNLVQRVASDDAAITGGPFDDLLNWVDMTRYKAQLVNANNGVALPP